MNAIRNLIGGLTLQLLCYAGQFGVLVVAIRCLSSHDFGLYASGVATATFFGAVLPLGVDRLLLRGLARSSAGGRTPHVPLSLFAAQTGFALLGLALAGLLYATAIIGPQALFVAALSVLTSARIVLSAEFKYRGERGLNVIASFGLQPMIVSAVFGLGLLLEPSEYGWLSGLGAWYLVTLLVESSQLFVLAFRSRLRGMIRRPLRRSAISIYSKSGAFLSIWAILSQTALLSVVVVSLVLPPTEAGTYTLAIRISQVLAFPYIGAVQLLIPLTIRHYGPDELQQAAREILTLLWASCAAIFMGLLLFAGIGGFFMLYAFETNDAALNASILVLGTGNLLMAAFGGPDQIMVSAGMQRSAFRLSLFSAVLLLGLLAAALLLGTGIIGISVATMISLVTRCAFGHHEARKRIRVPIAIWDRVRA